MKPSAGIQHQSVVFHFKNIRHLPSVSLLKILNELRLFSFRAFTQPLNFMGSRVGSRPGFFMPKKCSAARTMLRQVQIKDGDELARVGIVVNRVLRKFPRVIPTEEVKLNINRMFDKGFESRFEFVVGAEMNSIIAGTEESNVIIRQRYRVISERR